MDKLTPEDFKPKDATTGLYAIPSTDRDELKGVEIEKMVVIPYKDGKILVSKKGVYFQDADLKYHKLMD